MTDKYYLKYAGSGGKLNSGIVKSLNACLLISKAHIDGIVLCAYPVVLLGSGAEAHISVILKVGNHSFVDINSASRRFLLKLGEGHIGGILGLAKGIVACVHHKLNALALGISGIELKKHKLASLDGGKAVGIGLYCLVAVINDYLDVCLEGLFFIIVYYCGGKNTVIEAEIRLKKSCICLSSDIYGQACEGLCAVFCLNANVVSAALGSVGKPRSTRKSRVGSAVGVASLPGDVGKIICRGITRKIAVNTKSFACCVNSVNSNKAYSAYYLDLGSAFIARHYALDNNTVVVNVYGLGSSCKIDSEDCGAGLVKSRGASSRENHGSLLTVLNNYKIISL